MTARALAIGTAAVCLAATAAPAQTYRTLTESRRLGGEQELRVNVGFGVGHFELSPMNGNDLYRVGLVYDAERFEPEVRYRESRNALYAGVDGRGRGGMNHKGGTEQRLDLALSNRVPIHLRLEFGAVEADLELGGLSLTGVHIQTGASETELRFSEPNRTVCETLRIEVGAAEFLAEGLGNAHCRRVRVAGGVGSITLDFTGQWAREIDTQVSVEMGLGGLTLRLPEDVGVHMDLDRFLVSVDRDGFDKRGSMYFSRNYESATTRLELEIDAALGNIDIEWVGR